MPSSSRIFVGFRALGFICNEVPLIVRFIQRRKEHLIITVVGKAFHTYGSDKLHLLSVSNPHEDNITCLAGDAYLVFTACKDTIYAWRRGTELKHTYKGHEAEIHILLPFGPYLISVDQNSSVRIWEIKSEELYVEFSFNNDSFRITSLLHPSTYLNKILLGSEQGPMQLWNIKTTKKIYSFSGWGCAITVLEQAPAIDVVAVGLADGRIIIHNLKYDETLMKFSQEWGPITAISFRTDGTPVMASGSTVGHIALWNLEEKRLVNQISHAHNSTVTGMKFLSNEQILVSSSPDNSLKMWLFDQTDGGGRLYKLREGHNAPPSKIRFHGSNGHNILSAGQDSTLRSFSTQADILNKNLGQASFNRKAAKKKGVRRDPLKMPPVIDFTSETTREKEWDSIAACHRGLAEVTTWSFHSCKMGQHKLLNERHKNNPELRDAVATCVELTSCGNFVLIGLNTGHVDLFNIQSGIHRGSYGHPHAHSKSVQGVAVDGLNQMTISGSTDQTIKFWKFKSKDLLFVLNLESGVAQIALHRESNLLAVNLDSFTACLIDIDTRNIVRIFTGHTNRITDLTFSPDSRWLVTASMDNTIRTWDIPSGKLIDCFILDSACTSIALSPTADFLATTHVDNLGVYLWFNSTLYSYVNLQPLPGDYQPLLMQLPTTNADKKDEEDTDQQEVQFEDISVYKSPEQISDELVTLSLLPESRWRNLLVLDVIKQRNKPKEPPKAPKAAPFFLPTVPGLEFKFDLPTVSNDKQGSSRILNFGSLTPKSEFYQILQSAENEENYTNALSKLKAMGPSAVDVELRSLSPEAGGSPEIMLQFLKMIDFILKTNSEFEVAQAYLGLFLKLHWDVIVSDADLLTFVQGLSEVQKNSWERIQTRFNRTMCIVNYLKSSVL